MDMNMVYRLVVLGEALVVIGIAAVMIYFGSYLAAPEEKRQHRAQYIRLYGLILVTLGGVYLLYSMSVL
jgi:putative Mn2+ efflux pump MntP